MNSYKLLTPGPLTTSEAVRREMLMDRCTWDNDYKNITQKIRRELLALAGVSNDEYTVVLMQGSGSFGVEATLNTAIGKKDKCLLIVNGAYGKRMVEMAEYMGMTYDVYDMPFHEVPDVKVIEKMMTEDITHVAMVHCETTTGMLNPVEAVSKLCQQRNKVFILDAMSSFGGVAMDLSELHVDYLVSSANKCIQGVPGFSFVIARTSELLSCKGHATSLVLDLVAQWETMNVDGKWRYTSPTHVVAAFSKAIDGLLEEGGIKAREKRYQSNNELLISRMDQLGFKAYVAKAFQSPIITTFLYPHDAFDFHDFYDYVKKRGYVLYPGKLTNENTFRIGNIGEIYNEDILKLTDIIQSYMEA